MVESFNAKVDKSIRIACVPLGTAQEKGPPKPCVRKSFCLFEYEDAIKLNNR
jgi:hypothetical protein